MPSNVTTINVSLPKKLRARAERKLERNSYASMSEYVRELIRQDLRTEEIEAVDALLVSGLTSGKRKPVREGFWRMLKTEAKKTSRRRA